MKLSHRHIGLANSPATFWSLVTVVQIYLTAKLELKRVYKYPSITKLFNLSLLRDRIGQSQTNGQKSKTEILTGK